MTERREESQVFSEQLLSGLVEALNRHDLDATMEFYTDDCEWDMPQGPEPCGRHLVGKLEVSKAIAARFRDIPNVQWEDDRNTMCGDMIVSEFRVISASDGKRREFKGCDLLHIREGKIFRKDTYWKIVNDDA